MSENFIHPTAVIGENVVLGTGNWIGPHVVLAGNTHIGNTNWIGPGVCIGTPPDILGIPAIDTMINNEGGLGSEHLGYGVMIGDRNILKEYVTIHAGSHRHTVVNNNCYFMPRSHLGHDCWLGNNVILSPSAQIAGHVAVGARSVIGMGALVHQFSNIGPISMVGMGCCVRGTVETCRTVVGEPHRVSGINKIGIQRLVGEDKASSVINCLRQKLSSLEFPEPLRSMILQWESKIVERR